jgi:hypothetical protein
MANAMANAQRMVQQQQQQAANRGAAAGLSPENIAKTQAMVGAGGMQNMLGQLAGDYWRGQQLGMQKAQMMMPFLQTAFSSMMPRTNLGMNLNMM